MLIDFQKDSLEPLLKKLKNYQKVVFTNGCFDLLHLGHITYLDEAKSLGDFLIVGLNSDFSIKKLKGEKRPIIKELDRAKVLLALKSVDAVIIFSEDTPYNLIDKIKPQVLVKGGDWSLDKIIGSDLVLKNQGEVKSLSFIDSYSTTDLITEILTRYAPK